MRLCTGMMPRAGCLRELTMPKRLTALLLLAAAAAWWAAPRQSPGKPADASAEPKIDKPATPAIESLQLEPASLTLSHGRDARQVLVWGVTKDGQKFDLTDEATLKSESAGVTLGADR